MKRRAVTKILLLLVLGAIVNVATAWGLRLHEHTALQTTLTTRGSSFPAQCNRPNWDKTLLRSRSEPTRIDLRAPIRAGWPFLSLRFFIFASNDERGLPLASGFWQAGLKMPSGYLELEGQSVSFPLQPIWPGFAINTIFYAAILWVLFALPFKARRYVRCKRGQCPACGYPIGTSEVCTECGNRLDTMKVKSRTCMGLPPPATPAEPS